MRRFTLSAIASVLVCGVASAADGGLDAGVDAGCTFGEADCASEPWMWCNAESEWVETGCLPVDEDFEYSPCNCAPSDPCEWAEDNYCDDGCLSVVAEMFDDSVDCTEIDGGGDSDSDTDTDSDADTDTGDAGAGADDGGGCGCRLAGAQRERSFLSTIL
ncbi:MAG: hypothetical protein M0R80_12230 [Proteobacteria bacterium]|nr:hypothetical protein [Pseudomonadota bacterium]